jgi:hypothetical protein
LENLRLQKGELMNSKVKVVIKIIKNKAPINLPRLIFFSSVFLSILISISLLINKIIQIPNNKSVVQTTEKTVPSAPELTQLPNNQIETSIKLENQPNLALNNITNEHNLSQEYSLGRQRQPRLNINIIPEDHYKQHINQFTKNKKLSSQLIYKVNPPNFISNIELEQIVNDIVNYVHDKGLSTEYLSISLINLKSSHCCEYAGYADAIPRLSASVTKLFWMVYLYALYEEGLLEKGKIPERVVRNMIADSDNKSASLIVDTITQTQSGSELSDSEFEIWYQKRLALNNFFKQAGYAPINISQKLFPTSYSKNDSPMGRDLQIRKYNSYTIKNYTTTRDVARLLFEIEREKSISPEYSRKMKSLLKRNLNKAAWENKPFNAIQGFFGEFLPENVYFLSKMGWNSQTRNDAAIIHSPDGQHKYILVVFGDHPSFYQDKTILPEISRKVYQQMTKSNLL